MSNGFGLISRFKMHISHQGVGGHYQLLLAVGGDDGGIITDGQNCTAGDRCAALFDLLNQVKFFDASPVGLNIEQLISWVQH